MTEISVTSLTENRGVARPHSSSSRRTDTVTLLAGVVLIAAIAFGLASSASASEGVTGVSGATGATGETSKPMLTKQWWKQNSKAIKLITKQCKYRPAYRLLMKIRKPGLAVRGYLHMGWLALASYGVSTTYGAQWKRLSPERKAQRRKVRRKMAKTARRWAIKGRAAKEVAEENEYEGIPYVVKVDYIADGAVGPLSVGAEPWMPSCERRD